MASPIVPIDLRIPHRTQQTEVWCWAAVSEMVIAHFLGAASTPPQKELARMALGLERDASWENGIPAEAIVPHATEFVRLMVKVLSRRASDWYPACPAEELYANLYFGNPVILQLRTGESMSHVVVAGGMRPTAERGRFEVLLNDPAPHVPGPFWARYDDIHPAIIQHMVIYKGITL
jgi:hypothetical protein